MCANSRTTSRIPRGIRNNNPLNIRIGNTWLGEVPNPTESEFEQFVSIRYGLRAAFVILRRYIRRYQRNTPALIISSWAPSSENNTEKYINTVCKRSGIAPGETLDYENVDKMVRLVAAMAYVECGQEIDPDIIRESYLIA